MIRARHSFWADQLFRLYVTRLLKRHFRRFHLLGERPSPDPAYPLLLLPNHSSWWDGFWVYLLNQQLFQRQFYVMMLERELRKYPFFSRIGAFGIDPDNPKGILHTLQYTVEVMNAPGDSGKPLVCIFPQGELRPWARRPLDYKRGIDWIIEKHQGNINVLPLAMRAEYLGQQHPEVFFLFGKSYLFNAGNFPGIDSLEAVENFLLDDLALRIIYGESGEDIFQVGPEHQSRGAAASGMPQDGDVRTNW
ncbi:MAG: lysophospholipid acyltransferase family protein [Calditrichaeota bacterium]|nr:lysophospholipid acyltransferase family protein [Calditrichota bacterium]